MFNLFEDDVFSGLGYHIMDSDAILDEMKDCISFLISKGVSKREEFYEGLKANGLNTEDLTPEDRYILSNEINKMVD